MANTFVAELLVAAYQKNMENDFFGLSNSVVLAKEYAQKYGSTGLHIDGHSRGSLTIDSTLKSLMKSPDAQGLLSKTTVNLYGPAANVKDIDTKLAYLQNREKLKNIKKKNGLVTSHQTHFLDTVSRFIGKNSSTGGSIPKDSSNLLEIIRVFNGLNTGHLELQVILA